MVVSVTVRSATRIRSPINHTLFNTNKQTNKRQKSITFYQTAQKKTQTTYATKFTSLLITFRHAREESESQVRVASMYHANLVPRARAHLQSAGSKSLVLTKRNAASGNEIGTTPVLQASFKHTCCARH